MCSSSGCRRVARRADPTRRRSSEKQAARASAGGRPRGRRHPQLNPLAEREAQLVVRSVIARLRGVIAEARIDIAEVGGIQVALLADLVEADGVLPGVVL